MNRQSAGLPKQNHPRTYPAELLELLRLRLRLECFRLCVCLLLELLCLRLRDLCLSLECRDSLCLCFRLIAFGALVPVSDAVTVRLAPAPLDVRRSDEAASPPALPLV